MQLFIAFANFYLCFIQDFLAVIQLIIEPKYKNTFFIWSLVFSNIF